MHPPKMPKQVCAFLGLVVYYRKFIRNFAKIAKPLTLLPLQQAKFEWTPVHHNDFLTLKESVIQAPILHYPNPKKCYIVYTDASAEIIVCNDHKPLARFPKGKNANNKVNRWGLELPTYNITFEWVSGSHTKAAHCLSHLVEVPPDRPATINMLSATNLAGPAFNTRRRTAQHSSSEDTTSQTDAIEPNITDTPSIMLKSLTADRLQALLQMQKTDQFCTQTSK